MPTPPPTSMRGVGVHSNDSRRWLQTSSPLPAMEIRMPSLSPTMTEGTIVEWYKKEGDPVAPGDVLCDIQTDKAVMGFELEEEGVLAKILVPRDAKNVKIGELIAILADEGEDIGSIQISSSAPAPASSTPASAPASAPAAAPASAPASAPEVGMVLKMPSLSPTMNEGTIVEWLKKEGDEISPGDILCEIQTDKAVVGFELEEEGFLGKILVPLDSKAIAVGMQIAIIVDSAEDVAKAAAFQLAAAPAPTATTTTPPVLAAAAPAATPAAAAVAPVAAPDHGGDVYSGHIEKYGPAVRMLLQLYGLDESALPRTGRKGWLLKTDVLDFIHRNKLMPKPQIVALPSLAPLAPHAASPAAAKASPAASPAAAKAAAAIGAVATPYRDLELTSMRKTIAKRLTESKTTIPHAYAVMDCSMDAVLSLRKSLKAKKGISNVSVNDFVIKAVAVALKRVPAVNAIWDNNADSGQLMSSVDISVAVATPGGLITPIVKEADGRGIEQIADTVKALAGKAREGKLQPHEYIGGSFSISNLGMFGVTEFSAVINPPQAGILAIGSSRVQPSIEGEPETMMKVTLSYDARIVEQDSAFQFLEAFRDALENPMTMI